MNKKYLILEYTEFNHQQMNNNGMPTTHSDNPQLSHGAFDKHIDNIRTSNIRLNVILNKIKATNNIYNSKSDSVVDGMDISDLKILRMFPKNGIDIDVYITFKLDDKEYYGVINNFMTQPDVKTEAFTDPDLHTSKEWLIKMKGSLIKVIKNWMNISPSKWMPLKEIQCTDVDTGELIMIPKNTTIKVIRTLENSILINHNDRKCELKNMNFYYFNYWFEKI